MSAPGSAKGRWALPACASVLLACDPGYAIRGHVREPAVGDVAERAAPIEGAKVEVICPADYGETKSFLSLPTGADGGFSKSGIGGMSLACTVHVTKAGYAPRQFLVRDLCASDWGGICGGLTVETSLPRASAAPPSSSAGSPPSSSAP